MSIKKGLFEEYSKERESSNLNKALVKKANYSHHKVFDTPTFLLDSDGHEQILLIETSKIENWLYSDRPESELGDIHALADDFRLIGQQQPCIVRPHTTKKDYYELIAGERRWKAAKLAGIKLKAISKNLSDKEAALIQAAENENRKGLSDYAKGISYAKLIDQGILEQKDLTSILKISKQQVSRLLSFSKIPPIVIEEIEDMSKISARTAEQIKQICSKGQEYIEVILSNAQSLKHGKIGANKLMEIVNTGILNTKTDLKILDKSSRYLFSWKKNYKNKWSISLSEDVSKLISTDKIQLNTLTEEIRCIIEKHLVEIK